MSVCPDLTGMQASLSLPSSEKSAEMVGWGRVWLQQGSGLCAAVLTPWGKSLKLASQVKGGRRWPQMCGGQAIPCGRGGG